MNLIENWNYGYYSISLYYHYGLNNRNQFMINWRWPFAMHFQFLNSLIFGFFMIRRFRKFRWFPMHPRCLFMLIQRGFLNVRSARMYTRIGADTREEILCYATSFTQKKSITQHHDDMKWNIMMLHNREIPKNLIISTGIFLLNFVFLIWKRNKNKILS